jgi:hypothetical protein
MYHHLGLKAYLKNNDLKLKNYRTFGMKRIISIPPFFKTT